MLFFIEHVRDRLLSKSPFILPLNTTQKTVLYAPPFSLQGEPFVSSYAKTVPVQILVTAGRQ
jgi:hypothetical protein